MAAKRTLEERLAKLDAQKKTLQARIARQSRAQDTRRKVLLGAFMLNEMQHDPKLQETVRHKLPGFLSRDADKALFTELLEPQAPVATATQAPDTEIER